MASKGKQKQRYKVNVAMQAWDLAKAGAAITLTVRNKGEKLGTIEIGQGTFGWKGSYGHDFKRIPWRRLADKLNEF